jgi:protein-S-isoprenylcysteine O-methyltransferase Ste14
MNQEKIINFISSTASGNWRKKLLFTPVLGSFFIVVTSLFVLIPLFLDRIFKIPELWNHPLNYFLSLPFILAGIILAMWSIFFFLRERGTPVPVNPPMKLIIKGPYVYSRNPMTAGLFLQMFGVGIFFGSALSIFIFTPLYILIHVIELKKIEEPELERRLGEDYIKYKRDVPMIIPKLFHSFR